MSTWFLVWALGFLVLLALLLHHNHTATDPEDRWPPGCVLLMALWPVLVALGAVAFAVFWLDEWIWGGGEA